MEFYILSDNFELLQTTAGLIDQGEGYPIPGGETLHHVLPETRQDGLEYALLADDVVAQYLGVLVAAVTDNVGNVDQMAADWVALQVGEITEAVYEIPAGAFAGVAVRIGSKGDEWTQDGDTFEIGVLPV